MIAYIVTTGRELFDSETGPTIGYSDVVDTVVEFKTEEDAAEYHADNYETILRMVRS